MSNEIWYEITTGPLDKDWLVAEIRCGENHLADLTEWGEKIHIYKSFNYDFWNLRTDDFLTIIMKAKERLKIMSKKK